MTKLLKYFSSTTVVLVFLVAIQPSHAQTKFIKYKKYLIPIQSTSCDPYSAHAQGVPTVFYMDDIGFGNDPDGVTDLPIVMAWHEQGLINLVGVGIDDNSSANKGLAETIIGLSVDPSNVVPVYTESGTTNKLIELSESLDCLHIAIGGTWKALSDALDLLPAGSSAREEFIESVSVSGIGSSNIGTTDGEQNIFNQTSFGWYVKVRDAFILGEKLERLDRVEFQQSCVASLSNDLNFGVLNTRTKRRAVDDWYDAYFLDSTLVGRWIRDYGTSSTNFIDRPDSKGVRFLLCNNLPFGGVPCPSTKWGDKNGVGMKLRTADFNAIAYLIWGVNPSVIDYSDSMKEKLEQGWGFLRN